MTDWLTAALSKKKEQLKQQEHSREELAGFGTVYSAAIPRFWSQVLNGLENGVARIHKELGGNSVRFDKQAGTRVVITPLARPGEAVTIELRGGERKLVLGTGGKMQSLPFVVNGDDVRVGNNAPGNGAPEDLVRHILERIIDKA